MVNSLFVGILGLEMVSSDLVLVHEFRLAADAVVAVDDPDVVFDGVGGEIEVVGDLFFSEPFEEEVEDGALAGGEIEGA